MKHSLVVYAQYTPIPTKPLVATAIVHGSDAVLPQRRCAHDARLDGDVEVGLFENAGGVRGEELGEGEEFGVAGSLGEVCQSRYVGKWKKCETVN